MKPVKQTVWQAANTAERAGRFNRASGGRPTPTGRGPRDTRTYIRHDREARGPMHGLNRDRPRGPRLHRCMMESQGKRSESGFTATDYAGLEMVLALSFFCSWVRLWKWKELCHPQLWSLTGADCYYGLGNYVFWSFFCFVYILFSRVTFLKGKKMVLLK